MSQVRILSPLLVPLLRPAASQDRERLLGLLRLEDVARSLSVTSEASLAGALDDEPERVLVIGQREGVVRWELRNRRSRIASVHTLAVDPAHRGRGLAVGALRELVDVLVGEHGMHRVEAETYGFNEPARRAFLRAGFEQEGVRRQAYDRHGAWQDGILFGLVTDG